MYTVTHIFTRFLPFQNQHRTSLSPTSRVWRTKMMTHSTSAATLCYERNTEQSLLRASANERAPRAPVRNFVCGRRRVCVDDAPQRTRQCRQQVFSFGPSASETSLSRNFGYKEKRARKEIFRHRAVCRSPPCDKPLLIKVSPWARSMVQKRCENGWERYFDSLVSG